MSDHAFADAVAALSTAFETGSSFCLPFLDALPITHAAVSTLGRPFGSETVCASDAQAARLDELQIDFGVGPCWDALASRAPVIDADLHNDLRSDWPLLREAISNAGIRSVYAFPLAIGNLSVGAVDLYASVPSPLTPRHVVQASTLADAVATQVVRQAIDRLPEPDGDDVDRASYSRREVHQATGMIIAQLNVNAADALLLLRANAFAAGRPVREVAADVVARRISFADDPDNDESKISG